MKKSLILFFVLIIAALSVMSVSAAPRDRYYDQMGNKHWCNSDSYGCWVTGENGEHEYIMFWSESARDAIMGPGSKAPLGTNPGTSELPLLPPKPAKAANNTSPCNKTQEGCLNECKQIEGGSCASAWVDDPDKASCHCHCDC